MKMEHIAVYLYIGFQKQSWCSLTGTKNACIFRMRNSMSQLSLSPKWLKSQITYDKVDDGLEYFSYLTFVTIYNLWIFSYLWTVVKRNIPSITTFMDESFVTFLCSFLLLE